MNAAKPYVVGIGAANVDICGKSLKDIVACDSNPGRISISSGGVTRNILDNLSRFGVQTKLISAIGTDGFSQIIRKDCKLAGIDLSHMLVLEDEVTSSYIDILDHSGDLVMAVSDMSILQKMSYGFLETKRSVLASADAIVVDGCLPEQLILPLVADLCSGKPVFVDTVSTAYAKTVKLILPHCHTIKPNLAELAILAERPVRSNTDVQEACEQILRCGTQRVIVTLGKKGCYYADANGEKIFRSLSKLETIENATGAGDAFTAGLLYGYMNQLSILDTLDFASAASIIAISSINTINPLMSADLVFDTIRSYRYE